MGTYDNNRLVSNKIYLIDKEEGFLHKIKDLISPGGFECRLFSNLNAAVEVISAEPPGLVILDYYAGPADAGRGFVNSLLNESFVIPFIITADRGDERLAVEMMKLGAADFFLKDDNLYNLLPAAIQKLFSKIENEKQIAEIKLKYNRARNYYLSLLEDLSTIIWRCDTHANRDYFNKMWTDFTGRPLEKEINGGWMAGIHPQDKSGFMKGFSKAFNEKKSFELEYRLARRGGEYRWLVDHGRPFYDLEGNFAGYLGSCVDITDIKLAGEELIKNNNELEKRVEERTQKLTEINKALKAEIEERRQVEASLATSKNKYRELVELSNEGYWVLDKFEKTVFFNQKIIDLLGCCDAELDSAEPFKFMDSRNSSLLKEKLKKLRTGERQYGELAFVNKNGLEKIVKVSISPTLDSESDYNGALMLLTDITDYKMLEEEIRNVRLEIGSHGLFHGVIAKSGTMRDIVGKLPVIAENQCNVLLEGDSGTGKSVIARAIHNISDRRNSPFVVVDCGAIPDALLESELFGYMRGAFTDAKTDKPGKLALAEGGTLFLDEIGEMPLPLQVKLLRIIEEKRYEPLGGIKTVSADVRVIAATNKDLKKQIDASKFREDLYYRLKIVSIKLPPLRERREDAIAIMMHLIEKLNSVHKKDINLISEKMRNFITAYNFPGNVRELQNMLEYAFLFIDGNTLDVRHLPPEYQSVSLKTDEAECIDLSKRFNDGADISGPRKTCPVNIAEPRKHSRPDEEDEKNAIVKALENFDGNRVKAARYLKMSRMQLWRKMKKYLLI
jgi:PAS domain S-box-containing protein